MGRHTMLAVLALQVTFLTTVQSAQQQLKLSDSYLPVAMQIIAHLTDQMAFETPDDITPSTARTTTRMTTPSSTSSTSPSYDWTTKPTGWTTKPTSWTSTTSPPYVWTTKPTGWTTKPTSWTSTTSPPYVWTTKPTSWTSTTSPPYVWTTKPTSWTSTTSPPYVWTTKPTGWTTSWTTKPTVGWTTNGWWTTKRPDQTTPFHAPGLFAPFSPPKPFYYRYDSRDFLLPMYNSQYTVLGPDVPRNQETRSDDPLLDVHHEEVKPLVEPTPNDEPLLPPHFDVKISSRSDGFILDDVSEESLQYLSEDVREMLRMAKDPNDERVVDVWERSGPRPAATKAKMSTSNLRLLLLYDLLSRDAKSQKLSEFSGFSPEVMKVLVESSSGGARAQLRMALDKMVQRKDCGHDYANNRAKEMVVELGKDESKLSSELRYLQPLVYKY